MAALSTPTNVHVDPNIDADSGTGTTGDPYGRLQYALDNCTQNTTGPTVFWIADTAATVMAANITVPGGWTTSNVATFWLRTWRDNGLTGDGTLAQAKIQLDNYDLFTGSEYWAADDIEFTNDDTNGSVNFYKPMLYNCKFDWTATGCSDLIGAGFGGGGIIHGCHIKAPDITYFGTWLGIGGSQSGQVISHCLIEVGGNRYALIVRQGSAVHNNIVVSACDNGILSNHWTDGERSWVYNNTVLRDGAVGGNGIVFSTDMTLHCFNNYVEGFSNGIGATSSNALIYGNAAYNNTTNYNTTTAYLHGDEDNESLSASGIAKSGSITWANRAAYFEPQDEGNMLSPHQVTHHGYGAKGAVQPNPAGGAGVSPAPFIVQGIGTY